MQTFTELANASIRNIIPYQPGKPIEEVERELGIRDVIKLASNENPLGASPQAIRAAQQALAKVHLYPDGNCFELKQALASTLGVTPQQLTIGNGSENIFEIIVKTFLNPDHSAIISQYAFATIPLLIKAFGAQLITIPVDNWRHDINTTIKACDKNTRIIFVVNPNNPTGSYNTSHELTTLLESVPSHVLVVLDEAYKEYITQLDYPDALKLFVRYPNLIITRTFSKIYGLAGLRIGYAIASAEITDLLNRARLPFNVNAIGVAAACAALLDQEHTQRSIQVNQEGRKQLEDGFKQLNIAYIPSIGNFITIDVVHDANLVYQALLHKGVIIRPLSAYGLPTYLRITIGTYEQNERFLEALQSVLQEKR